METSANPSAATLHSQRLQAIARHAEHGYAALSREDKAAFGIDTWVISQDTQANFNGRVSRYLIALSQDLLNQAPEFVLADQALLDEKAA